MRRLVQNLPLIVGILGIGVGVAYAFEAENYRGDIASGGTGAIDGNGNALADIDLKGFALKDTTGNIDIATSTDITGALTVSTTLGVTGITTLSDSLDMSGNPIIAGSGEVDISAPCISGHSAAVCIQGVLETNAVIWADGGIIVPTISVQTSIGLGDGDNMAFGNAGGGDMVMQFNAAAQTTDTMMFFTDTTSRMIVVSDLGDAAVDWVVTATGNPTMRWVSTAGAGSIDEWVQIYDDGDANIEWGVGELNLIGGNVDIAGEHTMHAHGYIDSGSQTVTISTSGDGNWVEVDGCTSGVLRGFTQSACDFTMSAGSDGDYLVAYMMSFSGATSATIEGGISIDDSIIAGCRWSRKMAAGGDVGSATSTCICPMVAAEVLKPEVQNLTNTNDVVVTDISITLTKL